MRCLLFLLSSLAAWAQPVEYYSLVMHDYSHREPLEGWVTTERVLARTLGVDAEPSLDTRRLKNPDRPTADRFFKDLALDGGRPRWVYLAAHQFRDGDWDTPDKERWDWLSGWPEPDPGALPFTVVILDACHAGHPDTVGQLKRRADWIILAGAADEETFELPLSARRPVQFERRFPEVMQWLGPSLDRENPKISFLGFIWSWSLVECQAGGAGKVSLHQVMDRLPGLAEQFRRERSHRFASSIRVERGLDRKDVEHAHP